MHVVAIVPQKRLAAAKSRLETVLNQPAREILSLALLRRVCEALQAAPAVDEFAIMTADPLVRSQAVCWGIPSYPDPGPDLNAALAEAMRSPRTAASSRDPVRALLVLAADLPFVTTSEITELACAAGPDTLVLAPSKDGMGTNALVVPPGVPLRPAFGIGSRAAHRRAAAAVRVRFVEIYRPGLAFDVDVPADLQSQGWRGLR